MSPSSAPAVHVNEEVRAALDARRAVVALESTIIVQGLPAPMNLEVADACEAAVRAAGAVPATATNVVVQLSASAWRKFPQ